MEETDRLVTVNNLKDDHIYEVLYRNWTGNDWNNPHTIIYLGKFIKRKKDAANIFDNELEFIKDNTSHIFQHRAIHMYREINLIDQIIRIVI
jgi:hypothetical protein